MPTTWLIDSAAAFWPSNASYERCHVVFGHPALEVRSPDPNVVLVMKLYRADPQDREDLVTLWPCVDSAMSKKRR